MCSGKSDHFLPPMWYRSRFTNKWKPDICHRHSTYVTQKCQIFEKGMYDDQRIDPLNARDSGILIKYLNIDFIYQIC